MNDNVSVWIHASACLVIGICALAYIRKHREEISGFSVVIIALLLASALTNASEPFVPYQIQPEARISLLILGAIISVSYFISRVWYSSEKYRELVKEGKMSDRRGIKR